MKLLVGLGNPGARYAETRHNAGAMAIDRLAGRHGLADPSSGGRSKFHSTVFEGAIADQRCLLMKPMTFMNRSGLAVGEAANFYKLDPSEILILVDDVALPFGRIRLRPGGGCGGHNGLLDVKRALGTQEFPRLRIGVDAPGRVPQVDYVLGRFSPDQASRMQEVLDLASDATECWLKDGVDLAMTRYNAAES